tara:strand:+ start:678 stop:908 length:231 start_codon:yes stop_codon:yes gene_type:complete
MSFKGLVSKLQKGGKSAASAKAIAGSVAKRKREGHGKGPTDRQKKRMSKEEIRSAAKVQRRIKRGSKTKMRRHRKG